LIRWQFKLEPTQVLEVTVKPVGAIGIREKFFARLSSDGRLTIPRLVVDLLKEEEESLVGSVLEVDLQPTSAKSLNE